MKKISLYLVFYRGNCRMVLLVLRGLCFRQLPYFIQSAEQFRLLGSSRRIVVQHAEETNN